MANPVRYRRLASNKFYVWTSTLSADVDTSPTITSGSSAPSASEVAGSLYLRSGQAIGTSLYSRSAANSWLALNTICPAIKATVAATGGTGGATAGTLTVDCYQADDQVLSAATTIKIIVSSTQYAGSENKSSNVTFSSATKGSILASGSGYCIAMTDADGEFDCTISDSTDETVYVSVCTADGGSSGAISLVVSSNSDSATWSA